MSCAYDIRSVNAAFPESLAPILVAGRSNIIPAKKRFLGGRKEMVDYPTAEVEVVIKTADDVTAFLQWWTETIEYGTLPFTIMFPFFGSDRSWTVLALNDALKETPGSVISNIKLQLRILDDIDSVVSYYAEGWTGRLSNTLFDLDLTSSFDLRAGVGEVNYDQPSVVNYFDADGNMVTAGVDEGAFNDGLVCNVESTNLITGMQDFTDPAWEAINGVTVVRTGYDHIGGGTNAAKFINDAGASDGLLSQNVPVSPDSMVTMWAVLEYDDLQYAQLVHGSFSNWETRGGAMYDLINGEVVGTYTSIGTGTITASIKGLGNNRYLCVLTGGITAASAATVRLYLKPGDTDGTGDFVGDGVSGTIIHMAQVEALPFATSPIFTDDAPVTRLAQTLYMSASSNIPELSAGATFAWRGVVDRYDAGIQQYLYSIYGSSSETLELIISVAGIIQIYHQKSGSYHYCSIDPSAAGVSDGDNLLVVVRFYADRMVMDVGSEQSETAFAMSMPAIDSAWMTLGSQSTTIHTKDLQGKQRRSAWWPVTLDDAEVQRLQGAAS